MEVEKEVIKEVPVEKEVVVEKILVATPTAAPAPAEVEVNPGKVIWMVGGWANEGFDYALGCGGDPNQFGRMLHGFLLEVSDEFELIPGIASDWDLSSDGLTWSFTIREGVKFHDGTEVTVEDVLWSWDHYFGPGAEEYTITTAFRPLARITDRMELAGPDKINLSTTIPNTAIPDYYFSRRGPLYASPMPAREKQHDLAAE